MERKQDWIRDLVVYQVYPRSFMDSNGDGIGDLNGVRQKLPYLKKLGVNALWLSPFFCSPGDDNGYDVSDYDGIQPEFGTMADCEALIRECREELGVTVAVRDVFMEVTHTYPDLTVHLTLFDAAIAEGVPQKLEHNDIRWLTVGEIDQYPFCPADEEILARLRSR